MNILDKINEVIDDQKEFYKEFIDELPSKKSIKKTEKLLNRLHSKNLFEDDLLVIADGGLCLVFRKEQKTMYFEVYNDNEMGYLIDENNKILANKDLKKIADVEKTIYDFLK